MDLKGATSCGRCAGEVGGAEGVVHRPASPFCWAAVGHPDVGVVVVMGGVGRWGGAVLFTHCAGRVQCFSLSMLGGAGSVFLFLFCFPDPVDGTNVIAWPFGGRRSCVSLGSRPILLVELYHWLQGGGTGGPVTSS